MKILLPLILMLALTTNGLSQCFTVLKTNNVSSLLTVQKGLKPSSVSLVSGASYDVLNNVSYFFETTNDSFVVEFSNELIVKVDPKSNFAVNNFFQEILNTNPTPEKSRFGSHNFAATLLNGSVVVSYSGGDSNSSCIISTPMADYELHKGLFSFKVTENKVLVFVLAGSLTSHVDKRENVVTAGYASIAVPNDIGILEAKISIGAEKVKKQIIDKLITDALEVVNGSDRVLFATIGGKVMGILLR